MTVVGHRILYIFVVANFLLECRMMFKPSMMCLSWTLLTIAKMGCSSYFQIKLDAMQSSFLFTQILSVSDTFKCDEIFAIYRPK